MKTLPALTSIALFALMASTCPGATPPIPKAFGQHVNLAPDAFKNLPSFSATQKVVGTYYFYWYNAQTGEHIIDHDNTDALTTHPADTNDFSYLSQSWHRKQLLDMIAAGIDIVLPVFWGAPSEQSTNASLHWSYAGLPHLVQAREALVSEGKNPPRIGMFYDTSTLQYNRSHYHADLTTDYGRQWFYASVRDFFSMIPPRHWAMIDGKPIVLLYSASFAKKHDQSVIDFTKSAFARDFGGRIPWIAREVSWQVKADSTVAWGGALGLKNPGVASIGPGYDHSAVPGRTPLIIDRKGGSFYEENWLKFLRRPSHFVMVETWNEFHEGTDIAESREYGRRYIELTRKYIDLFKQGWKPDWPAGEFSKARAVSIDLGVTNRSSGLRHVENEDGVTAPVITEGRAARHVISKGSRYIYFAVDDSFKQQGPADFDLEVQYFDGAPGTLSADFDGSDIKAPFSGAYSPSSNSIKLLGDRNWKTGRLSLPNALFLNSQNRGADLRLVIQSPHAAFASVRVLRRP